MPPPTGLPQQGKQVGLRPTPLFRKPRRVSITLPEPIYRELLERSNEQGRSISNLAAFLLEQAIASQQQQEQEQEQQPSLGMLPLADQSPWPWPGSRSAAA